VQQQARNLLQLAERVPVREDQNYERWIIRVANLVELVLSEVCVRVDLLEEALSRLLNVTTQSGLVGDRNVDVDRQSYSHAHLRPESVTQTPGFQRAGGPRRTTARTIQPPPTTH
jgi:hypothetical protein